MLYKEGVFFLRSIVWSTFLNILTCMKERMVRDATSCVVCLGSVTKRERGARRRECLSFLEKKTIGAYVPLVRSSVWKVVENGALSSFVTFALFHPLAAFLARRGAVEANGLLGSCSHYRVRKNEYKRAEKEKNATRLPLKKISRVKLEESTV